MTLVSEFSCLSLLLSVTLLSTLSLTPLYSLFTHTSLPTPCTRKRSHLRSHAARANSWETPADSIDLPSFPSVNLILNSPLLHFYSYFLFLLLVRETGVTFAHTPRGLTVGKPQRTEWTSIDGLPKEALGARARYLKTYLARRNRDLQLGGEK